MWKILYLTKENSLFNPKKIFKGGYTMHKNIHIKRSTAAAQKGAKAFIAYCILQLRKFSNKPTSLTIKLVSQ